MNEQKRNKLMMLASGASIATAVILFVLKAGTFFLTGSIAILSSLFDSIQDFISSLINMIATHQSIQPADKMHRFGHGKAQGIGSLLQTFIIALSAVFLFIESVLHLLHHNEIKHVNMGIYVILISILLTFVLVGFQNFVIRQTSSLSIKADQAHYRGDILMNVGVLISLLASYYFGWYWLDGAFGILVALYLLYTIWKIMKEACAMLMDKELSETIRKDIHSLVLKTPRVKNISELRTREGGNKQFVQFNVQFDGNVSLKFAHTKLDLIEQTLHDKYPNMEVIIHAEPYEDKNNRKEKNK